MLLAGLRRSSRSVALWLLLVSLWGLPHRAEGADACPPRGAEQHDESKHVFSSEAPDEHGEHCAVCHWLRWLKPTLVERVAEPFLGGIASGLSFDTSHDTDDETSRRLAARAPPSLSH
jgi:hypothetical protein